VICPQSVAPASSIAATYGLADLTTYGLTDLKSVAASSETAAMSWRREGQYSSRRSRRCRPRSKPPAGAVAVFAPLRLISHRTLTAVAAASSPTTPALELLAASPDGCTEAVKLGHGFSIDMMVELINAVLATATPERIIGGGYEKTRVRITEEGRRALGGIAASRLIAGGEKST
jgi:hypothetical protein